jgi:hypothetical protein
MMRLGVQVLWCRTSIALGSAQRLLRHSFVSCCSVITRQDPCVMTTKSFDMDANVLKALEDLRSIFSVKTDGEVIARALGLAVAASKVAGNDRVIRLSGPAGERDLVLDR